MFRFARPPEIVFDEGLGDIFAIRVAGNVAGDDETASIEDHGANICTCRWSS